MKTTILSVLTLLGFFTDSNAETAFVKGINYETTIAAAFKAEQYQMSLSLKGDRLPPVDQTVIDPATLIALVPSAVEESIASDLKITEGAIDYHGTLFYIERPNEETVAADRMITESRNVDAMSPLYLDKTIENVISEDNQIIELTPEASQPLDFLKIDKAPAKFPDNKKIIGMN